MCFLAREMVGLKIAAYVSVVHQSMLRWNPEVFRAAASANMV